MADQLQNLLDRINDQGIKKAEATAQGITENAQNEAKTIIKNAEEKAALIIKDAKQEAELQLTKGRESLSQAARDVLLSLREQLQSRMHTLLQQAVSKELSPKVRADIIDKLATSLAVSEDNNFEVMIGSSNSKQLEEQIFNNLSDELKKNSSIKPVSHITGGFRLTTSGSDIVYDFSDEALAETMAEFLNPKLATIITG